ncbi:hypothetical protein SK571_31045 [Lentzea sp. BCCO 10_0798]|uniref:HEAT repeat-containing protein n=1 Tax=Lentzea kristufekii TaxID=3095430 RepID=A0ABU4TZU0_9PSEU|nr:hypothetical protein [Lentzea sp. BCCO 10_0798]MDX8053828.1 hypothetical protein [Lentzea sp. BCCO 10_0798]
MTDSLRPGDLSGLAESSLAAAGEFVALAALARSSQNPDPAVAALAAASRDEVAFTWLWALVRQSEQRWRPAKLPGGIAVPDELHQQVTEFICSAPSGLPQRQTTLAEDAAARLLTAIGGTPLGLNIARATLSEPQAPSARVRTAACDLLGASTDPEGRVLVRGLIAKVTEHKRAIELSRLHPPYSEEELTELLSALAHITNRPVEEADFKTVATVAARLPDTALAEFLATDWSLPANKQKIMQFGLVQNLGAARLQAVLAHPVGEATTRLLLSHAQNLPAADLPELGSYTFSAFPSEWSKPIWNNVAQNIHFARQHRAARRGPALEALWTLTLASSDDQTSQWLAELLDSGDLIAEAREHTANAAATARLGAVAAALLQRKPNEAWAEEVAATASELGDDFYAGLGAQLPHDTRLPDVLRPGIMASPVAMAALARNGFATQLVEWADTAAAALTLLDATHSDLTDSEILSLLARTNWATIGTDAYVELCQTLHDRLPILAHELELAVQSLTGPEASAAPPEVLAKLLTLGLHAGLRHDLGDQATTDAVTRLLDLPATQVVDAASAWVRSLDLSPDDHDCDPHRVRTVLEADNQRGGTLPSLSALRTDLAARLSDLAQNTDLETPQRVAHLLLAAEVDPGAARAAALLLGRAINNNLRTAAATVLAETQGHPDDLDHILELLNNETRQDIRQLLEAAKHRIHSGTIGEALTALTDLVNMPKGDARIDPLILIPDASHHQRFIHWVDRARARADNQDDPGEFIAAVINLADQMVDFVLISATDAGANTGLKPEHVQALRDNGSSRLDVGALLIRQQLQQLFSWFPTCLTLRRKRTAHPSPLGTTQPHNLGPNDLITAKSLFRDITEGWIDDMHRYN